MSNFSSNSRYVRFAKVYRTTDRSGREVQALGPAEIPAERELGEHLRRQGQRLDHLAAHYLNDSTGYWRLTAHNDAMSADVLSQATSIRIPVKA